MTHLFVFRTCTQMWCSPHHKNKNNHPFPVCLEKLRSHRSNNHAPPSQTARSPVPHGVLSKIRAEKPRARTGLNQTLNSIFEPFFPDGSWLLDEHDRADWLLANVYLLSSICTECFPVLQCSEVVLVFRGSGQSCYSLNREFLVKALKILVPKAFSS